MSIKPIVAGNWKMNKTPSNSTLFISNIINILSDIKSVKVIVSPPFTSLSQLVVRSPIYTAAQNCHWEESGAFTGEISIPMLKDCGVEYVIIGHSERRHIFKESDKWINNKLKAILAGGLKPILCVGETLDQREKGQTDKVLFQQLTNALVSVDELDDFIIAYEPVWAIGTGVNANVTQIENAHKTIKEIINQKINITNDMHILYGGSVNSNNAEDLISIPGVDGFLIGGASLDANSFASIVNIVEKNQEKQK